MAEIIPAILEKEFAEIEKKIHLVEGLIDWVQIDIADNTLVPNTTFLDAEAFRNLTGPVPRASQSGSSIASRNEFVAGHNLNSHSQGEAPIGTPRLGHPLSFELHMMVKDPLRYLPNFAKAGFKRFYTHVEGDFVPEYIERCLQLGVEVGLAVDGPTDFEKIHAFMDDIDCILVMAIEAGFSGRPFREDTVEKIRKIRAVDFEIPIAVDGAINDVNGAKVVAAGATRINSNSYIFSGKDREEVAERIRLLQRLR